MKHPQSLLRSAVALAGLFAALSGCSTMATTASPKVAAATSVPAPRPAPTVVAAAYPNINQVPPRSKAKLLTPEEKEKVIAELEELAKAQGQPVAETSAGAEAACNKQVAETLNPEKLIKREAEGQKC